MRWLAALHYFWAAVVLSSLTVAVVAFPHAKQEACLRWWGMALQFFGIVMLVVDLRGAQREFGQPGALERIRHKMSTWPKQQSGVALGAAIGVSVAIAAGSLKTRVPADPSASLKDRVKALEANLHHVDTDLADLQQRVSVEGRDREAADRQERAAREAADKALEQKMTQAATGSFTFSLFGVVWLAIGLVLSSTSVETAKWVPRLGKALGWL